MDVYEDIEVWYKYRPTPKEFLDKLKLVSFMVTSIITIRNWKKRYSKPYHVEFVIPSLNTAYSAIGSKDINGKVGVRSISLDDLDKSQYGSVVAKRVNVTKAIANFKTAEGEGYDYLGISLSQIFNANRRHPKKKFCSSAIAFMLDLLSPHQYGVLNILDYIADRNRTIEEQEDAFSIEKHRLEEEIKRLKEELDNGK